MCSHLPLLTVRESLEMAEKFQASVSSPQPLEFVCDQCDMDVAWYADCDLQQGVQGGLGLEVQLKV